MMSASEQGLITKKCIAMHTNKLKMALFFSMLVTHLFNSNRKLF